MSNFWQWNWLRSLKKFEKWSFMTELKEQYLTEKQNSYLQRGHYERVDYIAMCSFPMHEALKSVKDIQLVHDRYSNASFARTIIWYAR